MLRVNYLSKSLLMTFNGGLLSRSPPALACRLIPDFPFYAATDVDAMSLTTTLHPSCMQLCCKCQFQHWAVSLILHHVIVGQIPKVRPEAECTGYKVTYAKVIFISSNASPQAAASNMKIQHGTAALFLLLKTHLFLRRGLNQSN